MSDRLLQLTDANFDTEVLQSPTPVLVDFGATWCMPCQMLAPTIEALATEYAGKARVGAVDTDRNPKVAVRYEVSALPTVIIFKEGKIVDRFLGMTQKAKLAAALEKQLEPSST